MSANGRYLVVSLGSIGRRHAANLKLLKPSAHVIALRTSTACDELPPFCDEVVRSFDDLRISPPDAAIIASPAPFHVGAASALISLGVPVLVEKPLSDRLEGLDKLQRLVEERQVPCMVGYNLRFDSGLLYVKRQVIDEGVVGKVTLVNVIVGQFLPDWRPGSDYRQSVSARRDLGGGPLLELSHELDYLYWFFGLPDRVTCRGGGYSALEIDVEDAVQIIMEYDDPKRIVSVSIDFLRRVPNRTCALVGEKGTVTWDGIARDVHLDEPGKVRRTVSFANEDRNAMYLSELSHFLDCVEQRQPPITPIAHGRDVMAIIEAAKNSMAHGMPVPPFPMGH